MITSENIVGPLKQENPDQVFLNLKANNGSSARYSLFSLNTDKVPEKVELHGRTYKRKGNTLDFEETEGTEAKAEAKAETHKFDTEVKKAVGEVKDFGHEVKKIFKKDKK